MAGVSSRIISAWPACLGGTASEKSSLEDRLTYNIGQVENRPPNASREPAQTRPENMSETGAHQNSVFRTIKVVGHMAIIVGAPALVWNEYSTELNGL